MSVGVNVQLNMSERENGQQPEFAGSVPNPSVARSIQAAMSNALFPSTTGIESSDAVIRVYDEAGNVIETHEHTGDFKEL